MSEPSVTPGPVSAEERRRQLLHVAGGLGMVVAVGALALFVLHKRPKPADLAEPTPHVEDERLREALAEVDRLDPHWRFAELEEARAKVSDTENAARLVRAAFGLIPRPWRSPRPEVLRGRLRQGMLDDNPRLDFEPATPALLEARKLAGFSRGRHAVAWNMDNPLLTPLLHLDATRDAVEMLTLDAEMLAHEGDVDKALVSIRAALVAAQVIGDEPMLLSQERRLEYQRGCVEALEETLRRGQGTDGRLFNVQVAVEAAMADPVLRTAARAERAGLHGLMTALEKGKLARADPSLLQERAEGVNLILGSEKLGQRESLEAIHAWLLDYTTQFAEIAGRPPHEQPPLLAKLADSAALAPPGGMPLARALSIGDLGALYQQDQALLRCAAVAVALERYRLANGRWPDKLGDVAPKYLTQVPADPYDGQPLRYARHKDVVVVYAVGPDGKDDGGKPDALNQFGKRDVFDVGFRLWDVTTRHKAVK
jgi:hypothetical protein